MTPERENRTRAFSLESGIARIDRPSRDGPDSFIGTVVTGGSAFPAYYAVRPILLGGNEAEGIAPVNDPSGIDPIEVAFYDRAPTAGSLCIAVWINEGSRWVALRKHAGGSLYGVFGTIPTCFCTQIPTTLIMTSTDEACNYRMYQSCTLIWEPTPAWAASLNLGANVFFSTESFPDPISGSQFYYHMICHLNQVSLTRIYPTSPYGSPYRDAILWTWLLGAPGNICNPFTLVTGAAFPGSDLSCYVRIDAPS